MSAAYTHIGKNDGSGNKGQLPTVEHDDVAEVVDGSGKESRLEQSAARKSCCSNMLDLVVYDSCMARIYGSWEVPQSGKMSDDRESASRSREI